MQNVPMGHGNIQTQLRRALNAITRLGLCEILMLWGAYSGYYVHSHPCESQKSVRWDFMLSKCQKTTHRSYTYIKWCMRKPFRILLGGRVCFVLNIYSCVYTHTVASMQTRHTYIAIPAWRHTTLGNVYVCRSQTNRCRHL